MGDKRGFTLIELLIVVAIIGIIAAIAIPNLIRALQNGKQIRTLADIKSIGTGIEMYRTQVHFLPSHNSITIAEAWATDHVLSTMTSNDIIEKDGWGNDMYMISDRTIDSYSVGSAGKNGAGTVPDWSLSRGEYIVLEISDFEFDLIFCNGQYSYGPNS